MSFKDYFEKFEKMQGFIIPDLRRSTIKAKANFLVTMGIFNYIEQLGGFCLPDDIRGICEKRFNFVFENELLPKEYKNVFNRLQLIANPYDCLRCGMTHEYFIKTYGKDKKIKFPSILGVDSEEEYVQDISNRNCGLELNKLSENEYQIRVYNPRFIHDLNLAFEEFKIRISSDIDYRKNFEKRCSEIHLEQFI